MINFFKDNGVGKIQFASGDIAAPVGRVSIYVDDTTDQLVIAEDGRDKFWVATGQPLQVNGAEISGTNEEKAALIAPVFQNAAGGGGGGKFGDEDNTSDVDRSIDMQQHNLDINNAASVHINSHSAAEVFGNNIDLFIGANTGSIVWADLDGNGQSDVTVGKSGADPYVSLTVYDYANNKNNSLKVTATSVGITGLQSFASNAEAVAVLGVGKLYQSTTSIGPSGNGSPIILITV